jgi:hypothetical protein
MKKILTLIIIATVILNMVAMAVLTSTVKEFSAGNMTAVQAPSHDAIIGLWGGKWDDTWPIFLLIETNSEPNTYKVHYRWLENLNDSEFSEELVAGYKPTITFMPNFWTSE